MSRKGLELGFSPLKVLSEREVLQIIEGNFTVLERTGIVVEDPDVLKLMESAGCKVDYSNKRVRIPESVITDCLDTTLMHICSKQGTKRLTYILQAAAIHFLWRLAEWNCSI